MSGLISQSFIDDLLNRTDIVEVVSSRIQLKKTGKNYSACCPFHKEKTPSFSVSPDKQFYYCFGCGAGGNALGFVMDHDNLDFPQAIEELARSAGMEVQRDEASSGPRQPRQPSESPLYPLLSAASDFYRQALKSHPSRKDAVNYLKNRGLSGEIARDFALGFAPPGWDNLLKHFGDTDNLQQKHLIDAGLVIDNAETGKRYDRFRDRVIFPIRDTRGRIIAFGGRVLGDDKPKYLNSPETPVFHKGQELYGLYEARQHNRNLSEIIVVEGYMDVIALAQQNLRNAVATLGTATSEEHLKRIFRLVPSVLFCFDGDAAGRKAAWRALEATLPNLQDGRRARFLFLPEGDDPDSLVRSEGTNSFLARIEQQALSLGDYFFQQLSIEADPRSLEGKAHLATLAAPLIDKIPGSNLRALMQQKLSELTGLSSTPASKPQSNSPALTSDYYPAGNHSNEEGDFAAYFAYEQQNAQSWQSEPKERASKGNWKNDKQKGPREPRQPRQKVKVESPTLTALRTLLHRPDLAQKVESADHFSDESDLYTQLLVALLGTLQKSPQLRSLQLIARWHGTEQGRLLLSLAEKEWLIDEANLEQQFFDTITTLASQQRERSLQHLLNKSREGALSGEEKAQLLTLLSSSNALGKASTTGA